MGEIDPDLMMDSLFKTLVENGKEILDGNDRPGSEISEAMDTVIKWFSDNERYEECTQLKKIKEECLKLK